MPSDLDEIFSEVLAQENAEGNDDDKSLEEAADSGPGDEPGELEDDGEPSADGADDGTEPEAEPEAEELDDDEGAEPEPEPEPEPPEQMPNPVLLNELSELRRQVAVLQQERAVLSQQQQAPPAPDPSLREAVRILAFGGDEKQLQDAGIPRHVQAQAARLVTARSDRLVDEILDPASSFQHMAPMVERTARQQVAPIQQQLAEKWATETVERLTSGISVSDRKRVGQIMETIPGKGVDSELIPRLELAVKLFKQEQSTATLEQQKQKVKSRERQDRANRRARRGGGKPRSRRGAPPPVPDMKPDEDLEAYERRVQEHLNEHGGG
jgi:hypothetical protein